MGYFCLLQDYMQMDHKDKHPAWKRDRRKLFSFLGWALAGLASAGMSWVTGCFLAGNDSPASILEPSSFGPPEDHPIGTVAKKGRVVLFRDAGGFWAVTAVCTHLGCQPAFDPKRNMFVCPCHGSRFDAEGRVLAGPATESMSLATLRIDSQGALVAHPKEKVQPGYRFG